MKKIKWTLLLMMLAVLLLSGPALATTTTGSEGSFSFGVANCLEDTKDRLTIQIPPKAFTNDIIVKVYTKAANEITAPAGYYVSRATDIAFSSRSSVQQSNPMVPIRLIYSFDLLDYKRASDMDTTQPLGKFRIAGYNSSMHKWETLPTTIFWDGQQGQAEATGNMGSGRYALFWDPSAQGASLSSMGDEKIRLYVNYKPVYSEVEPFIYSGRTMVPIGILGENLGAEVTWFSEDQHARIVTAEHKVEIWVGNNKGLKDDQVVTLQVPPMLTGGRTFVPIGFVSQALGAEVNWDGISRTVYVVQNK
jgi:hypothetical protein